MCRKKWCFLIVLCLAGAGFSALAADPSVDSLRAAIRDARTDSGKVDLLVQLAGKLYGTDPAQAIEYATQARDLAMGIHYNPGLALSLKYISLAYNSQSDYLQAITYARQSMEVFRSMGDEVGVANMLNNIGAVYFNQGEDAEALDYYLKSLSTAESTGNKLRIATALLNIGAVYYNKPATYDKAVDYYLRALPIAEDLQDGELIGTTTVNLGEIYLARGNTDSALHYFRISLKAYGNSDGVPYTLCDIGKVYLARGNYSTAVNYFRQAYASAEKFGNKLYMIHTLLGLGDAYDRMGKEAESLSSYQQAREMAEKINANYELKDAYLGLALANARLKNFAKAYEFETLYSGIKDSLYNFQTDRKIMGLQFRFDIQKKQNEINLLLKDNALKEESIKRQKLAKNSLMLGLALVFIIVFVLYRGYRLKVKTNRLLDQQKSQIQDLLHNILPQEVARDLQHTGQTVPKYYDNVSVLFSDFKGFSRIADDQPPQQLVEELSQCFVAFDGIIEKYHLEKIKTIGDAYMCAGGIPVPNKEHPLQMVRAAQEMQAFIREWNQERERKGLPRWEMRIGIHTGPVVAGVVGKKKYSYDIWGTTVNIASRMESNGAPGQINISQATYQLIKDQYSCFSRGKINAKNIGEIEMYFVEGKVQPVPVFIDKEMESPN